MKKFLNISLNPNLNYWFIKKYKKYINFKYLSFNKFELDSYYYYKNRKEGSLVKNSIIEEGINDKNMAPN